MFKKSRRVIFTLHILTGVISLVFYPRSEFRINNSALKTILDNRIKFTALYVQISSFKIKVQTGGLFGAYFENLDFNFLNIKRLRLRFEPQPGHLNYTPNKTKAQ